AAFGVNCALKAFDLRPFTMSRHRCADFLNLKTYEQCSPRERNDLRGEKFTEPINRTKTYFVNRRSRGRVRADESPTDPAVSERPCRWPYPRGRSDLPLL